MIVYNISIIGLFMSISLIVGDLLARLVFVPRSQYNIILCNKFMHSQLVQVKIH